VVWRENWLRPTERKGKERTTEKYEKSVKGELTKGWEREAAAPAAVERTGVAQAVGENRVSTL
jgi:hypothetical protein